MSSSPSATLLLLSEAMVDTDRFEDACKLWTAPLAGDPHFPRLVYRGTTPGTLLDIVAFDRFDQFDRIMAARQPFERQASAFLKTDWRRQILGHVEDVKTGDGPLPISPSLELRHIEVPPPVQAEYRAWRRRTIFEAVRDRPEVDRFSAYHSVVSGSPGVMFVVGFSCDDRTYSAVYETPEYRDILRQAGTSYIAGGLSGLETRIYHRLAA